MPSTTSFDRRVRPRFEEDHGELEEGYGSEDPETRTEPSDSEDSEDVEQAEDEVCIFTF